MEEMRAFFTRRVEGYDEHMLQNVAGCAEGYELLAQNLLENAEDILADAKDINEKCAAEKEVIEDCSCGCCDEAETEEAAE